REAGAPPDLEGLPELVVRGLDAADARALLLSASVGRLDEQVVDRIVAEARGIPLALVELSTGRTVADVARGFRPPGTAPLSVKIEESFLHRLRSLPANTQRLLLIAAADPTGNPALLWRAAGALGLGPEAAAPAEQARLLELGATVRFPHPLARSAG